MLALLLATALITTPTAKAADTWTKPFPGVDYLYRTTSTPNRIHVAVVDLCAAGVSARATRSSEKGQRTSSFGSGTGAEVAINGDFFSSGYAPSGLAMGNGVVWAPDNTWSAAMVFGTDEAELRHANRVDATFASWTKQIVSGHPQLIRAGERLTSSASVCASRHPRTAIGLSEDRHTLYLAVVDGRSSASAGMTCGELGSLMASLGAHDAVNLDGGGSSTMWMRGKGVVSNPSDGSERVVANHLAIQANGGTSQPGSCDRTWDEATLQVHRADDGGTTDVDGDGAADLCARSATSLTCFLSGDPTRRFDGPALSDASGWGDRSNHAPIRFGDVNGDGLADVCSRSNSNFRCWPSNGTRLGARIDGPDMKDAAGWANARYYSTIRLADFNGDGRDDVCARTGADFRCWRSTGTGFGAAVVGPALSDAQGWGVPEHFGTIRMGDIDGDGKADLCARSSARMRCWKSKGDAWGANVDGPAWSNAAGWDDVRQWSTIRLADVDGDGKADLCGRGSDGYRCHLSTGSGFGPKLSGPNFSDGNGWADHSNYGTIALADVDGDGDLDVCARGDTGVRCWLFNGSGFSPRIDGPVLSDANGWSHPKYYETLRWGDVNGDGKADLCGRAAAGMLCWLSDGAGGWTRVDGPPWSNANGWGAQTYYSSVRLAGPRLLPDVDTDTDTDTDPDTDPDPDPDTDPDPDPDTDPDTDTDTDPDTDPGDTGETGVAADTGLALDTADEGAGGEGHAGCGCASSGVSGAGWMLLGLLALMRRRRGQDATYSFLRCRMPAHGPRRGG